MKDRQQILGGIKPIQWDKNNQFTWFLLGLRLFTVAVAILFVTAMILLEAFGIPFIITWDNAPLFILVTLTSFLDTPFYLYHYRLEQHKEFLSGKTMTQPYGIMALNEDLDELISKINSRFLKKWYLIVLAVLIILLALFRVPFNGPEKIWEIAKLPVAVFYVAITTDFIYTWKKLNENIRKTESLMN